MRPAVACTSTTWARSTWEEINLGAKGANYGWPLSEGPDRTGGFTAPLFSMRHHDPRRVGSGPGGFITGFAIVGGAFYPSGGAFPRSTTATISSPTTWAAPISRLDMANGNVGYSFGKLADSPVDMLVGHDGALYVLTRTGITRISAP